MCSIYFLMYFPSAVLERSLINICTLNALFSLSVALMPLLVAGSARV